MSAATKRFAVIGHPVAHSLSPTVFGALFAAHHVDATYERVEVSPAGLEGFIAGMRSPSPTFHGLSVTLPHKERILSFLDEVGPRATRAGAVNTVVRDDGGGVRGFNTDVVGIVDALHSLRPLSGLRWLILGAGGAARAAMVAAEESGAASVAVHNRTPERAAGLVRAFAGTLPLSHGGLDETLGPALARADVVVNATSLGLGPDDASPLGDGACLEARHLVLDTTYGAHVTALEQAATRASAAFVGGRDMLVAQALAQYVLFTGRQAPLDVGALRPLLGGART